MILSGFISILRQLWQGSRLLHFVTFALLTAGVLFIYSSTFIGDEAETTVLRLRNLPPYIRQMMWIVIGVGLYVFFAVTDYRQLKRYEWAIFGGALVLLVLVLLMGRTISGAQRWIMIYGGFGVQPSEVAKLATIILLAGRLSEPGRNRNTPRELILTLLLVALPGMLILQQPDLGTALVFLPTSFVLMFVAGVPFRYIGGLAGLGVSLVLLILAALFLPAKLGASEPVQQRIASFTGLSAYQRSRIEVFFNPGLDPLGAGWNRRQSEIAVGSGGLRGKGYLQGTQNILGYLPRSVAPTDFIYSVIAEETGFVGSATILAAFGLLLMTIFIHGLANAGCARTAVVCRGRDAVFFHVFINIAMTVGLMPITGLPLPLLSYGGSFLMVVMSALGIVQSVYIRCDRRTSYR
jgi:rod shape determining protein RodA